MNIEFSINSNETVSKHLRPIEFELPTNALASGLVRGKPRYEEEIEDACDEVVRRLGDLGSFIKGFKVLFQRQDPRLDWCPDIAVIITDANNETFSFFTGIPPVADSSGNMIAPTKENIVNHLCNPENLPKFISEHFRNRPQQ
ncbi:MAG: hypothetical protein Q7S75_01120 [bacterium]|nr:hypothetical protein [bacterium]